MPWQADIQDPQTHAMAGTHSGQWRAHLGPTDIWQADIHDPCIGYGMVSWVGVKSWWAMYQIVGSPGHGVRGAKVQLHGGSKVIDR